MQIIHLSCAKLESAPSVLCTVFSIASVLLCKTSGEKGLMTTGLFWNTNYVCLLANICYCYCIIVMSNFEQSPLSF